MKIWNNIKDLLLIGAVVLLSIQQCAINTISDRTSSLNDALKETTEIIDDKINSMGERVVTTTVAAVDQQGVKLKAMYDEQFTSLSSRLEANSRKLNNLQSTVEFTAEIVGEGYSTPVIIRDTVPAPITDIDSSMYTRHFVFNDGTLDLRSTLINPHPIDSSLLFQTYSVDIGTVAVDIFRNGNLFKKDDYSADLTFSNPNIKVGDANVLVKRPPVPRLVIGPAIGGAATIIEGQLKLVPIVGVTATLPLIKIYDK